MVGRQLREEAVQEIWSFSGWVVKEKGAAKEELNGESQSARGRRRKSAGEQEMFLDLGGAAGTRSRTCPVRYTPVFPFDFTLISIYLTSRGVDLGGSCQ